MARLGLGGSSSGTAAGALIAGAVSLLALPSAVLGFSTRFASSDAGVAAVPIDESAPPAGLAPAAFRSLAKGQLFPFTPASNPNRPDRSVTVAVRIDGQSARAIQVMGARLPRPADVAGAAAPVIAPTGFNLGVARGFQQFSPAPAAGLAIAPGKGEIRKIEMPDLATFGLGKPGAGANPRFAPRIVIDEKQSAGRSPRTFAPDAEDRVDVGGSYRVARNLDVTAGVRYSQERDRLKPLTDGKQDSQAVYVGTQFRF